MQERHHRRRCSCSRTRRLEDTLEFAGWCEERSRAAVPVEIEAVCEYLCDLWLAGYAMPDIVRRLTAVAELQRAWGSNNAVLFRTIDHLSTFLSTQGPALRGPAHLEARTSFCVGPTS